MLTKENLEGKSETELSVICDELISRVEENKYDLKEINVLLENLTGRLFMKTLRVLVNNEEINKHLLCDFSMLDKVQSIKATLSKEDWDYIKQGALY